MNCAKLFGGKVADMGLAGLKLAGVYPARPKVAGLQLAGLTNIVFAPSKTDWLLCAVLQPGHVWPKLNPLRCPHAGPSGAPRRELSNSATDCWSRVSQVFFSIVLQLELDCMLLAGDWVYLHDGCLFQVKSCFITKLITWQEHCSLDLLHCFQMLASQTRPTTACI